MSGLRYSFLLATLAILLASNAALMPVYMVPFGFAGAILFLIFEVSIIIIVSFVAILKIRKLEKSGLGALVTYGLPILLIVAAVLVFTRPLASFGRDRIATLIEAA